MNSEEKNRRNKERLRLPLPVLLRCREAGGAEWTEQTRLLDLTPFGASFSLARPVEPGRLVHLTMPMPRQLRCFDHVEEQYRVYALVRWIKFVGARTEGRRFDLGVAFTGKHPPASYQADPTTRYGVEWERTGNDLWRVQEQGGRTARVQRETRLTLPVEVVVEVLDERGEVVASEQTVTENISRRGASVFTSLTAEKGKFARLRSARYSLAVLAVVRGSRKGADNIPRLHLEFVDRTWPLEILEG